MISKLPFARLSMVLLLLSSCAHVQIEDTEMLAVTKSAEKPGELRAVRYRLLSDIPPEKEDVDHATLLSELVGKSCASNESVTNMMAVIDKLCGLEELKDVCDFRTKQAMQATFTRVENGIKKAALPPRNKKRRGKS